MIITCSSHIKEERSISSIYNLLTGKRSIQTVQDAHIYDLDRYYGIFKKLNRLDFDQLINELVDQNLLTIPTEITSATKPTKKGLNWVKVNQDYFPFTYFNGLRYHEVDVIFLERLYLLIQVLANSKMKNKSYIPVIDRPSVTQWVRTYYKEVKLKVSDHLENVYLELSFLLNHFPAPSSEMFIDRLTGFQHYGLSIQQLADQYQLTITDVQALLIGMTHRMLDIIQQDIKQFPLLAQVIQDLRISGFITQSADQTYEFIKKGYTIEEISKLRRLKVNTIYDHIVEISLYDSEFPIHTYVSQEKQHEIIQAAQQMGTSRLKKIKDIVSEDISYFQIRLTLTSKPIS